MWPEKDWDIVASFNERNEKKKKVKYTGWYIQRDMRGMGSLRLKIMIVTSPDFNFKL